MANAARKHQFVFVLNNQTYTTEDPIITARGALHFGGFRTESDYSVIVYNNFGTALIGLDESFRLDEGHVPVLRAFESDRLYRALLNERELVWGSARIAALDLRAIGQIPDDQDLVFDSNGDQLIPDDGIVVLREKSVERIRSVDPKDETVAIILNGEQVLVDKGKLTFEQLAKLAFPALFGRELICLIFPRPEAASGRRLAGRRQNPRCERNGV
jgi:hypothetical protein